MNAIGPAYLDGFPLPRGAGRDVERHRRAGRDRARAVGDAGAVERIARTVTADDLAEAATLLEQLDAPAPLVHQWTIFEIGSSMIPVAPWSFSAEMSVLISDFATTASTAYASSRNSFDTVGDFSDGRSETTSS